MATKLYLPNLLEFIYHSIIEKGFPYLFQRLDREDFVKVKNESKVRGFAEFGNLEDKIILMSKIGMGCAVVFWDKEKQMKKKVEDVVIGYIDTHENDLTRLLVKDKTFCVRDIDFIKSLQTMSHSSMGKVYSINRKFLHIKNKSKNAITRTLVNKLEAENNLDWYSHTIQFALDLEEILEAYKIDMLQFRILLYLHTSPNGATKENIAKKVNRTNVTGMINEMFSMAMVDYNIDNRNICTIGVYGIIVLQQIFAKFP